MFQYTKENILNSIPKIYSSNGKINIEGLGEYVLENIVDKTVYVTPGEIGKSGKWTISVPEGDGERILTFRVTTPNQYLAEYATPGWQVFGKPIVVGFGKDEDLVESVKLAIPDNNKFIKVSGSGSDIVIEGSTPYIDIDKVYVMDVETGAESKIKPTVAEGDERVEPFATKEWIIENLRFPTYPNIRYASASTMPTADVYTEYAFTYRVPRVGLGGLSGVGQALDAVTRHIFYVPSDLAPNFEKGLAGLTFDKTVGKGGGGKEEEVTEDTYDKPVDTTVTE